MKVPDRPHEHLEGRIAADVLGGLYPHERDQLLAERAEHGPGCPECRALVAEYGEVAAGLAMSIDPVPVSSAAEERLVAATRLRSLATPAGPAPARAALEEVPAVEVLGRVGRPQSGMRLAAALAAAAVVAAVAGAVGYSLAPREPEPASAFAAFVASPSTEVATLSGEPGQRLAIAHRPGQTQAWVVGAKLPTPPGGRVYELWYQVGTGPIRPGGIFVPDDGTVLATVMVDPGFGLLVVTIEPPGGSRQPTSEPIFIAR